MSQTLRSLQKIFVHVVPDYYSGTWDFLPTPKSLLLSLSGAMSPISQASGDF